jgi:hypothetical protein
LAWGGGFGGGCGGFGGGCGGFGGGCGGFGGGCGGGCGGFGGCGGGFFGGGGCGFGCGGGFFGDPFGFPIFKHIIQTTSQVNTCHGNEQQQHDDTQQKQADQGADQNQKDKQTVCLNTAVNTAGHGFGGLDSNLGSDGVGH